MNKNINTSSSQARLTKLLLKRGINSKDIPEVLNGLERFVKVVRKIYFEPQAQIAFVDKNIGGKIIHQRVINTDFEELKKVLDRKKKTEPINEVFTRLKKVVTKDKYGRRRAQI